MKILYVISRPLEINTSASIRNRATIEGLLELGHSLELITTEVDKNHSNYDDSMANKGLKVTYLKLGGVQNLAKIGRKFKLVKPLKEFVYKIMSKFEIYDNLKGIVNYALKMNIKDGNYDMIISSSDPKSSHLFVSKMYEKGLLKKTPWIQIWGDPFLSDITSKNNLLNGKIEKEENRLFKYATKIIYVSSLTLKHQKKTYSKHKNKMFYEPTPYVKKEIYAITDVKKELLTFLYCGDYSSDVRNIRPLYEAIRKSEHQLIICGSSNIKLDNTERLKIYPRVSYEKTKDLEEDCDVLVHLSNLRGNQIPGKIYQYSATNKPILFILDGDETNIRDSFTQYNRYIFCNNNADSISDGIEKIKSGSTDIKNIPVTDFSAKKIAKQILEITNPIF